MDDNQEKLVLEALGENLKRVQKPRLAEARKLAMKSKMMNKLDLSLIESLQHQGARFSLGMDVRARIKENVFALIEKAQQKRFIFANFFLFQKKFVASAILLFMGFTMFMFMGVETNVVYAHEFTRLDSFSGDVMVERDGEIIEVEEDMRIYEKDKIMTGEDGKATVWFFDDSVSRLSSDTEILIDILYRPEVSTVSSYVEVDLIDGSMWSKVLNLVEKKSSFVVQSEDIFTAAKKAAFNVSTEEQDIEVDVYKNVVDVVTQSEVETVVSGQKAVMTQEKIVKVEKIAQEQKDSQWVKENLDNDKVYVAGVEDRILAAKVESTGSEVADGFDSGNTLKEDTLLLFTFNDIKQKTMELDIAGNKLISADIKLNDNNISIEDKLEVEKAIDSYSERVVDYMNLVEEVRETDYEYAEELEQYVEDSIFSQKKNLSLVLPDSPSYEIKKAVGDLELLVADNVGEEVIVKSEQGLTKLSEVEDALEKGDTELALQIVDEYKLDVDDMIGVIDSIEIGDDESLKTELVNDIRDGMELLDEIKVVETSQEFVSDLDIVDIVVEFEDSTIEREIVQEVKEDEAVHMEPEVVELDYGVVIEGDKLLSPLLLP